MARRYDPERRQRIIDAAIRIVELKGIDALSHRTVAAEADVPLGSTTYHFASLDDLLVAALEQVSCAPQTAVHIWSEALEDEAAAHRRDHPHPGGVRLGQTRQHPAGIRAVPGRAAPPAAPAARRRVAGRHGLGAGPAHQGLPTARALVALIDGLLLQFLLTDRGFDREEVRAALARVTGEE